MSDTFWGRAWEAAGALAGEPTDAPPDVIVDLETNLVLQRYVFVHLEFGDSSWLTLFRAAGLFANPPALEQVDGGVRATGWPVLNYLLAVAPEEPEQCAEIISGIRTDNWWVVTDALSVAAALPPALSIGPILGLMAQWESSPVQWTSPDLLEQILQRVIDADDSAALREVMSRIATRFIAVGQNHYDLAEVLPRISEMVHAEEPTLLGDVVEEVLALPALAGQLRDYWYELDDLDEDNATDLLLSAWLSALEAETSSGRAHGAARRASRLLGSTNLLFRTMGIRALATALDTDSTEQHAIALLEHLGSEETLTLAYDGSEEKRRLFARYFALLPLASRSAIADRLKVQATSDEEAERYMARDWLHSLSSHLGPTEEEALTALASELGAPRPRVRRDRGIASWVVDRTLVTADELNVMEPTMLVAYLENPPVGRPNDDWPPSGSPSAGFARDLRGVVEKRLVDFADHLGEFGSAARTGELVYAVAWGLREALRDETLRTPERLESVLEFLIAVKRRSTAGEIVNDATSYRGSYDQVGRAVADLVESIAPWLVHTTRPSAVVDLLGWLLSSDDPDRDEARHVDDPASEAINSVRGEAVLAVLRMRQAYWGGDALEPDELSAGLDELLLISVRNETSVSVMSSYGRFLAPLVIHLGEFFTEHRDRLLPRGDDQLARWVAVLGTYVVFSGPHRATATVIRADYELAADRTGNLDGTFLGGHIDRLLVHLVSLSLPFGDDSQSWLPVLHRALDNAGTGPAASAAADLAFAIRRDGLEVPSEWIRSFVGQRAARLSTVPRHLDAPTARRDEPGALLELVLVQKLPLVESASLLRSLLDLGAVARLSEVVAYLSEADPDRSVEGLAVLRRVITGTDWIGFGPHIEPLHELLGTYGNHPQELWSVLDLLGSEGWFGFEDLARRFAPSTANDERSAPEA